MNGLPLLPVGRTKMELLAHLVNEHGEEGGEESLHPSWTLTRLRTFHRNLHREDPTGHRHKETA